MRKLVIEQRVGSALTLRTEGLDALGHPEIAASVKDEGLKGDLEDFLFFICRYVEGANRLGPGETLAYGYWLTRFEERDGKTLEVWEYNSNATQFVKGASLTLDYWHQQHATCLRYGTRFEPPRPDKLTVLSKGVLEGLPVQGVRYLSPEPMSGWWITTDQYDGNVKSLQREHTYHLTAARPELAKYLALPHGFRFDLSTGDDVWKDDRVAANR
ncbi:MAG: hypothetical protein JO041_07915 [Acidobacteria bacterium]|nr:hypothetical protein [Acidobacteriota bacterium]